jgi:hypothetical protein
VLSPRPPACVSWPPLSDLAALWRAKHQPRVEYSSAAASPLTYSPPCASSSDASEASDRNAARLLANATGAQSALGSARLLQKQAACWCCGLHRCGRLHVGQRPSLVLRGCRPSPACVRVRACVRACGARFSAPALLQHRLPWSHVWRRCGAVLGFLLPSARGRARRTQPSNPPPPVARASLSSIVAPLCLMTSRRQRSYVRGGLRGGRRRCKRRPSHANGDKRHFRAALRGDGTTSAGGALCSRESAHSTYISALPRQPRQRQR